MRVMILQVHTVGEYDSTMDCDYALVNIDEVKDRLKKRIERVKKLADEIEALSHIEIFDSTPAIVSRSTAMKMLKDEDSDKLDAEDGVPVVTVASPFFDAAVDASERAEALRLSVESDCVYWTFFPKYTNVACETDAIQLADLE